MALEIEIPNNWQPRKYQYPVWEYLQGGGKRAVVVAHRRWGKDDLAMHWTAVSMLKRTGTYWHLLPEAAQARKAIWDAINPHTGLRRIDEAFPVALRKTTKEQEMFIQLKTGSTWQVVGSDNYDSLVGSPPVGVVLSEWAIANPAAWAYLRPILAENQGWALFIYTPRGGNHGQSTYKLAKQEPTWFGQISTALDTNVFTKETLDSEKREYMAQYGPQHGEALFAQEYLCSFAAASLGSYYGLQIEAAKREGRVSKVPWNPDLSVVTAWDIGIGDSTAIWFLQVDGPRVHAIDYYEASGQPLSHYAKTLQDKPYRYSTHIGPHDLDQRELGTGKTRIEIADSLGINFQVAARLPVDDGINAVRQLLPRMYFDESKCERGLSALSSYRKEWSEKNNDWTTKPIHDWASHGCDALRYFALSTHLISETDYRARDRYANAMRRKSHSQSWMTA